MPNMKDVILEQLQIGKTLIDLFTGDFSDAEYFQTPFEGANHVGWNLGHVACSEDWFVALIAGSDKRIPESLHELFKGGSVCVADAGKYPSRKELDELLRDARANTIEALAAFDVSKCDDASPEGAPRELFPTLGSLWGMQPTHQFWHIGQITVCRAALKKKKVLT